MKIIGSRPRPRVLISGDFSDDELKGIQDLVPTSKVVDSPAKVLESEWDLLVIRKGGSASAAGFSGHLFVVSFGSAIGGIVTKKENILTVSIAELSRKTLATQFVIPDGLPAEVAGLVERSLVPKLRRREENAALSLRFLAHIPWGSHDALSHVQPFITTTEPEILAVSFSRREGSAAWLLPAFADPVSWVAAALSVWSRDYPDVFPTDPGWRSREEWMTQPERELLSRQREFELRRNSALRQLASEAASLEKEAQAARAAADNGRRRLLTAQGRELVEAVIDALQTLGFEVQDRDEDTPPNDRLEDLWVTAPNVDDEWIAIAEVRGYAKGATVGDLIRITGRFSKRFRQSKGRDPSRQWYIVNHNLREDPSARPLVLDTNPNEVIAFGEDNGLIIDTRLLFRAVESTSSKDEIQQSLMRGTGRWTPPTHVVESQN